MNINLFARVISVRLLAAAFIFAVASVAIVGSAGSAAAGTDAVTGLPLYPGLSSPDVMDAVPMCGSAKGKMALYYPSAPLAAVDTWFAAHLHGFERMTASTDRPQIGFYNSGGTLIVGITGDPKDAKVYAVTYIRASPPLVGHAHQLGMLTHHC